MPPADDDARPLPALAPDGLLALAASGAQLVAAFLPWTEDGVVGLDLSLVSDVAPRQPTVGLVLIVLAAAPAVAALVSRRGWVRAVSAVGTGALALGWLAFGTGAALVSGVYVALAATVAHLVAAALPD